MRTHTSDSKTLCPEQNNRVLWVLIHTASRSVHNPRRSSLIPPCGNGGIVIAASSISSTHNHTRNAGSDATIVYMRFGLVRCCAIAIASFVCSGAFAQQTVSVDKLVEFLHSSVKMKMPDKQVASYVSKMRLSQRLEDRVIEQLQGDGVGPKTVQALRQIGATTASLPTAVLKAPPAPPPPPPPPSYDDQNRIITEAREYALNYTKSLPDFLCLQVTRRYYDPNGADDYRHYDTVMAKVSYFEQHEKYDLLSVNDKFMTASYESLGGTISSGEFGSMMREIFEPETGAEFHWIRWATLRGRRAHVYSYVVDQPHSKWSIEDRTVHDRISPGYSGLVYIDRETNAVMRITLKAEGIPPTFPIQQAEDRLDYDFADISGHPYIVPMMAQVHLRAGKINQKNDIEFRGYRKFSGDATIKFDDVSTDPIPEDKIKEQPVK